MEEKKLLLKLIAEPKPSEKLETEKNLARSWSRIQLHAVDRGLPSGGKITLEPTVPC